MRKFALLVSFVALGLLGSAVAQAHHAVQAQFDVTKNVILVGVLKKIDWQNPHAWFHFDELDAAGKPVLDKNGKQVEWMLETTGPNGLRQLPERRLQVLVRRVPRHFLQTDGSLSS